MRMIRNKQDGYRGRQILRIEVSPTTNGRTEILYDVKFYDLKDNYIGGISDTRDPLRAINSDITVIE